MDHLLEHLNTRIQETLDAITKYANAVRRDEAFIREFAETDPDVAQVYRDWKTFDQEKVEYFQAVLSDLQDRRSQRVGQFAL